MECYDRKRIHLYSAKPRALVALLVSGLVVLISAIVAGLLLGDAYETSVPYQRVEGERYRVFMSISSKLAKDVHLLISSDNDTKIEVSFNFIGVGIDSSIQAESGLQFSDYSCSNITDADCILPIVESGEDCGNHQISCDKSGTCDRIQIFGASTDEAMARMKLTTQKKSFTTSFFIDAEIKKEPKLAKLNFESVTPTKRYTELELFLKLGCTFFCCMIAGLFARSLRHYKWTSWTIDQKIFPALLLLFSISNWPYIYDWKPGSFYHLSLIQISKWSGFLSSIFWIVLLFNLCIPSHAKSPYQWPFAIPALVFSSFIALVDLFAQNWLSLCSSNLYPTFLALEIASLVIFCIGIFRNLTKTIYTELSVTTLFPYLLVIFNISCLIIILISSGLSHLSPIFMPAVTSSCVPLVLFYSTIIYSAIVLFYILRPRVADKPTDTIMPEIELN